MCGICYPVGELMRLQDKHSLTDATLHLFLTIIFQPIRFFKDFRPNEYLSYRKEIKMLILLLTKSFLQVFLTIITGYFQNKNIMLVRKQSLQGLLTLAKAKILKELLHLVMPCALRLAIRLAFYMRRTVQVVSDWRFETTLELFICKECP